jgi:predicted membrane protein
MLLAYVNSFQTTWLTFLIVVIIVIVISHQSSSSLLTAIVIIVAIAIVCPLFKRNIYLSLLCDWNFLYLQNHFSFPLQIVQLKCVIFLYFCAMYVKLTQCPVSHALLCAFV